MACSLPWLRLALPTEAVQAGRVALRWGCAVLGAIASDLPVEDARDASLPQVQDEAAVGLAGEGDTLDQAVHLELESWRLDRLLQLLEQIVIGPAQLVCLEDPLAGRQGEVAVLRLDLALEDRAELELRRHGPADRGAS